MKIGILTFHAGLNHGAYLQAFALMQVIQDMGHNVQIIDYRNKKHFFEEEILPWFKYRRPIHFLDRIKKQKSFHKDKIFLSLTSPVKNKSDINEIKFDVVVIGSDVVWNYKIFGFDSLFFGDIEARKIISYAASFGWVNHNEKFPTEVSDSIFNFNYISVRDNNSKKIIKLLTGQYPAVVLDPTLIYNFHNHQLITDRIKSLNNYILVYAYISDQSVIKLIKNYAKVKKLLIVSVGYRQFWCDKIFMDVGPMEWLGFYSSASLIATSTFHGTIFAIKYKKDFFYIKNNKAFNRVSHLADVCGLKNDFFDNDFSAVLIRPNYDEVHERLEPFKINSMDWIKKAFK